MQGARAPQPGATNRPSPSGPFKVPSAPDRSQGHPFLERCAAPRAPCERHPPLSSPRRNAPRGPAALAAGAHPDPYRTRKLSRPAPMVLQGRPCGRAGRRRPPGRVARARGGEARERHLGEGDPRGSPFSYMSAMCASIRHICIHVYFCSLTMPGNADAVFTFGHSGGGAQSALMGATATLIRSRRILRQSVL